MRLSRKSLRAEGRRSCLHAIAIGVVLAASIVSGQQPAPQSVPPPVTAFPPGERPPYRLVPGDTLDVKFEYVPDLNETVRLRPDGFISLQRIGEVRAEGLTAAELTAHLVERYASVLKQPNLTVIVKEVAVQQVFVGGEVVQPGVVPLRGQVTSLQAILATGGLRPSAKLNSVVLIRYREGNQAEAHKLDLTQVVDGKASDVVLQPFDVVYVPRSAIAKVGLFVEQYINALIPKAVFFPYNLNTTVVTQR